MYQRNWLRIQWRDQALWHDLLIRELLARDLMDVSISHIALVQRKVLRLFLLVVSVADQSRHPNFMSNCPSIPSHSLLVEQECASIQIRVRQSRLLRSEFEHEHVVGWCWCLKNRRNASVLLHT